MVVRAVKSKDVVALVIVNSVAASSPEHQSSFRHFTCWAVHYLMHLVRFKEQSGEDWDAIPNQSSNHAGISSLTLVVSEVI